ncbi:hypothetical protein [Halobacteriovorax sp. RT-2-6]|uniref:hypothetical protein n=1 Tax=unclassified Halobacteriovorax TaxID=2639665 RepID=UPI0039994C32
MRKLLLALALVSTLSASVSANCVGIYENTTIQHNEKASKNVLAVMGSEYKDMFEFLLASGDAYSIIVSPLAAVLVSPIVLYKSIHYKGTYKFYKRFVSTMNENSEDHKKDFKKFKRSVAKRFKISNEEFLDVLKDLNDSRSLCEGYKRNTVLTEEGIAYLESRGYKTFLQAALNGKRDPVTFRELQSNPRYFTVVYGGVIDAYDFKKIVRAEIEARGYEK